MAQNIKALTYEKGSLHYNILQPVLWGLAGIMHALPNTARGKRSYLHRDLCVSIHSDTPSVPTFGAHANPRVCACGFSSYMFSLKEEGEEEWAFSFPGRPWTIMLYIDLEKGSAAIWRRV